MLIFVTPPALVQLQETMPKNIAPASYHVVLANLPQLVAKPSFMPYKDLPLTEEDKQNIADLFRILATYSPIRLGKTRGYLQKELGPAVGRVHPLKMLEYFVNTPKVKAHVTKLRTRTILFYGKIWPNYIKPTGKDFDGLAKRGELDFYAKEFAIAVNKDEKTLRKLFSKRNWTALYDYLLDHKDET
jgi:hypothetical protein